MSAKVVDTNVWIVCGTLEPTGDACETACRDLLRQLDLGGSDRLVVDSGYQIFGEYRRHVSDQSWAKHVLNRIQQQAHYQSVVISVSDDSASWGARPGTGTWYREMPKKRELAKLDPSDRKFAAVALAHGGKPPIVYAKDADDWEAVRAPLKKLGIDLEWLCPNSATGSSSRSKKRRKP